MDTPKKTSELLLPVGDKDSFLAAIHNGADAIYVGMPGFNARGRSKDHDFEKLAEMIDMAHLYGVKVHVAMNILIFEDELERASNQLKKLLPLGPDALIIQDLGLARLVRAMAPTQVIHGSTQMTVTNADAIAMLEDLDIKRFVLGRENSLPEIRAIKERTSRELEVFVHGALCVAYSGQCFTSESIGGRSANRGQCAQSCRFGYEMIVDGKKHDLKGKSFLVSPKDLMGIEEVPALMEIGVESFKVEGRLKGPEYVATAARTYKQAMNGSSYDSDALALTYSRGFFSGWLHGVDHQSLVDGEFNAHRGLEIGSVLSHKKGKLTIKSNKALEAGMGLYIPDFGAKIYSAKEIKKETWELQFDRSVRLDDLKTGERVFLNSDPQIEKATKRSVTDREEKKRIPVTITISATVGETLSLKITDDQQNTVEVKDNDLLTEANTPISLEAIKKEITALGTTVYRATDVLNEIKGNPFIPNQKLKRLRQDAIAALNELRTKRPTKAFALFPLPSKKAVATSASPKLNILLRNKEQVEALVSFLPKLKTAHLIGMVILDFEFGRDYQASIHLLRSAQLQIAIATTRILKPGEYHNLNLLMRLTPDAILVRNLGAFHYLKEKNFPGLLLGDFSLNVANSLSADYLFKKGLHSLTPSYDLNQAQLLSLLEHSETKNFELTIHQYMPSFHMEHCVFAAFLSTGSSFKDCGKPCEDHKVELVDQFGHAHFLKADHECRNTMYNATPQSASKLLPMAQKHGVSHFRFEALEESSLELERKIQLYLDFFSGQIEMPELESCLGVLESYGLGSGQLFKEDSYKPRKQQ
jgi:putative protease